MAYKRDALIRLLSDDPSVGKLGVGSNIGTPIHFAIKRFIADASLTKKMINHGVNPNSLDSTGKSTLHTCFNHFSKDKTRFEQVCDTLLFHGCNPNLRDYQGMTALLTAARKNDKSAVKYAIQYNKNALRIFRENNPELVGTGFDVGNGGGEVPGDMLNINESLRVQQHYSRNAAKGNLNLLSSQVLTTEPSEVENNSMHNINYGAVSLKQT